MRKILGIGLVVLVVVSVFNAFNVNQVLAQEEYTLDELVEILLYDNNPFKRAWAASVLGEKGKISSKIITALISALSSDTAPLVRASAAESLGKLGTRAYGTVDTLFNSFEEDPSYFVKNADVLSLGKLLTPGEEYTTVLIRTFEELLESHGKPSGAYDPEKHKHISYIAKALGMIGDLRAVTSLIGGLWNDDLTLRAASAIALGDIGDPLGRGLREVTRAMEEFGYEPAIVEALGKLGTAPSEAMHMLLDVLENASGKVKERVAMALAMIGSPDAYEDGDWKVVEALMGNDIALATLLVNQDVNRLGTVIGHVDADEYLELFREVTENVGMDALENIIYTSVSTKILGDSLKMALDPRNRMEAVYALWVIGLREGGKSVIEPLVMVSNTDNNGKVKTAALMAALDIYSKYPIYTPGIEEIDKLLYEDGEIDVNAFTEWFFYLNDTKEEWLEGYDHLVEFYFEPIFELDKYHKFAQTIFTPETTFEIIKAVLWEFEGPKEAIVATLDNYNYYDWPKYRREILSDRVFEIIRYLSEEVYDRTSVVNVLFDLLSTPYGFYLGPYHMLVDFVFSERRFGELIGISEVIIERGLEALDQALEDERERRAPERYIDNNEGFIIDILASTGDPKVLDSICEAADIFFRIINYDPYDAPYHSWEALEHIANSFRNIDYSKADVPNEAKSKAIRCLIRFFRIAEGAGGSNIDFHRKRVQDRTIKTLSHIGNSQTVDLLIEEFDSYYYEQPRRLASEAIIGIFSYNYDPEIPFEEQEIPNFIIEKLQTALEDPNENISYWAGETLKDIKERYPELEIEIPAGAAPLQTASDSVGPSGDKDGDSDTGTCSGFNDFNINIAPSTQPDIFGGVWF